MNIVQKIAKNTTLLISMQIITMVLSLIFTAYLARYLGADNYGKYSFAFSFTSLFVIIVDIGFNQLAIREISRDKKLLARYISNIVSIKLLLSFLFFAMILFLVNLVKYPHDTKVVVYIFAVYAISNSFGGLFKSIFNAFELMEYTSIITIIEKVLLVSCGIIVLVLGYNLIEVTSVYPITSFISIIMCLIVYVRIFSKFRLEINFSLWKYLISSSVAFGIFSVFSTINGRIDTVLLSMMKSYSVVGWYNAAYNLVLSLQFIPTSFISSIFPLLCKYGIDQRESLVLAYKKSLKYLLIIAIPLTLGTIILADKIILLIYGEDFKQATLALQILIISIIPVFIHNVLGAVILATNKEKDAVLMWAICAIGNIMLNYALIPRYGLLGSSVTTLISEIVICLQFYYCVSKNLGKVPVKGIFYKPLIGSIIMSIFILLFRDINFIALVIVSVFVYFAVIYNIHTFSEEDMKLVRKLGNR